MNTRQISFAIQGMTCVNCAITIERVLTRRDGVVAARVNYAAERATVLFDPKRVSVATLLAVARGEGYDIVLRRVLLPLYSIVRRVRADEFVSARFDWTNRCIEAKVLPDVDEKSGHIPRVLLVRLVAQSFFDNWGSRRSHLLSVFAGSVAFAALVGVYLGIIALTSGSLKHAWSLFVQDVWLVGAIAAGFGAQIGLFTFLRSMLRAASRGVGVITGTGTGTSTISMLACCMHHVTDVAPILAMSGLTGAAAFLAEYRIPFALVGLAVNIAGIVLIARTIQTSRAHLSAMATPAVCH